MGSVDPYIFEYKGNTGVCGNLYTSIFIYGFVLEHIPTTIFVISTIDFLSLLGL